MKAFESIEHKSIGILEGTKWSKVAIRVGL